MEHFVFRPKIAIFRTAGMREEGLPLPLAFQYFSGNNSINEVKNYHNADTI